MIVCVMQASALPLVQGPNLQQEIGTARPQVPEQGRGRQSHRCASRPRRLSAHADSALSVAGRTGQITLLPDGMQMSGSIAAHPDIVQSVSLHFRWQACLRLY